jgi:hypothetical protein
MPEAGIVELIKIPVRSKKMPEATKTCLFCKKDSHAIPLVNLDYQGHKLWICPQHLPVLIHDPAQLVGKLPGAENMRPAEHND